MPGDRGARSGLPVVADIETELDAVIGLSSRVGKAIAVSCAQHHTKYTLEMGGKNPLIVLADADLDYAVTAAAFCNFCS